jgi:hypothetical protein
LPKIALTLTILGAAMIYSPKMIEKAIALPAVTPPAPIS